MEDPLQLLADTFAGLSHPVRLRMLYLLLHHRELCVCDFMGVLGITQSMASRHLRNLFHLGLVRDRRETVWMYYRISERLDVKKKAVLAAQKKWLQIPQLDRLDARLQNWQATNSCSRPFRKEKTR